MEFYRLEVTPILSFHRVERADQVRVTLALLQARSQQLLWGQRKFLARGESTASHSVLYQLVDQPQTALNATLPVQK